MVLKIYILILCYTLMGIISGLLLSRKKDPVPAKKFWLKFKYYILIIHIVFASIVFKPVCFHYLTLIIILAGFVELIRIFANSGFGSKVFFILSIFFYSIISSGFYFFGLLKMEIILFTFIVLSVFDAFSQICGQIIGKRKLLPRISPNKTIAGLIGGSIAALITSVMFTKLLNFGLQALVFRGAVVATSAFTGDLLASIFKRKYQIKDFSNALPGQGGFLDRFDSMLMGGALMYLISFSTF
jgi:phosphatidate cytidylyltransferase